MDLTMELPPPPPTNLDLWIQRIAEMDEKEARLHATVLGTAVRARGFQMQVLPAVGRPHPGILLLKNGPSGFKVPLTSKDEEELLHTCEAILENRRKVAQAEAVQKMTQEQIANMSEQDKQVYADALKAYKETQDKVAAIRAERKARKQAAFDKRNKH